MGGARPSGGVPAAHRGGGTTNHGGATPQRERLSGKAENTALNWLEALEQTFGVSTVKLQIITVTSEASFSFPRPPAHSS